MEPGRRGLAWGVGIQGGSPGWSCHPGGVPWVVFSPPYPSATLLVVSPALHRGLKTGRQPPFHRGRNDRPPAPIHRGLKTVRQPPPPRSETVRLGILSRSCPDPVPAPYPDPDRAESCPVLLFVES
jgi:hypothetical protein